MSILGGAPLAPKALDAVKRRGDARRIINEWYQLLLSTKLLKKKQQLRNDIHNDLLHRMYIFE